MNCVQVFDKTLSPIGRANDSKNNFTIVVVPEVTHSLHVYQSALTVPFLISGGSSEGWCSSTTSGNDIFTVTGLQYVVVYNWPSDGISLWYDYINSDSAYHSPAWPSSQLTNVSGTWTIRGAKGAFMAETTVSALVKGVPVMWSLYDVSYMNGTHE